jgi:hypothetical protein
MGKTIRKAAYMFDILPTRLSDQAGDITRSCRSRCRSPATGRRFYPSGFAEVQGMSTWFSAQFKSHPTMIVVHSRDILQKPGAGGIAEMSLLPHVATTSLVQRLRHWDVFSQRYQPQNAKTLRGER